MEWYALTLDRESLAQLQVVEGPESLRWRKLSLDGTVVGAAKRVARSDSEVLADETDVDVDLIHQFREDPLDRPLVLSTRKDAFRRSWPTATTARWRWRSGCSQAISSRHGRTSASARIRWFDRFWSESVDSSAEYSNRWSGFR